MALKIYRLHWVFARILDFRLYRKLLIYKPLPKHTYIFIWLYGAQLQVVKNAEASFSVDSISFAVHCPKASTEISKYVDEFITKL